MKVELHHKDGRVEYFENIDDGCEAFYVLQEDGANLYCPELNNGKSFEEWQNINE